MGIVDVGSEGAFAYAFAEILIVDRERRNPRSVECPQQKSWWEARSAREKVHDIPYLQEAKLQLAVGEDRVVAPEVVVAIPSVRKYG